MRVERGCRYFHLSDCAVVMHTVDNRTELDDARFEEGNYYHSYVAAKEAQEGCYPELRRQLKDQQRELRALNKKIIELKTMNLTKRELVVLHSALHTLHADLLVHCSGPYPRLVRIAAGTNGWVATFSGEES